MACPNLCRILQTFSLSVILFIPRPITSCFDGFTWLFVTLKRRSEPRENTNLCFFLDTLWWVDRKKSHANFVHLSGMTTWSFWKCWDERTFGVGAQVIFTANNNWWGHLAAFDNMVLSAASVSRLPWGRYGTASLSILGSNIAVPTFCYNNML